MKKICFFSGDITRSGGTERVAVMVANELVKQAEYKICFMSLCEQRENSFFAIDKNIERYKLGEKWISPGPGYISIIPKVRKFLREQDIDIIIDIDVVLDVLAIPASWKLKTKVVSWEHFNCDYEMSVLYRKLIVKFSVKFSDYVITLTEGDKERYGCLTGRTKEIEAIHNPMKENIIVTDNEKENWIVTAVRLVHDKGIDYLAEVAQAVLTKYPDWKWYVLGDGEDRHNLERFIRENKLENNLMVLGLVENVEYYLGRAKMFVLTSRIEGLPMCLLEAKTYYLPCISFDILTGPKEIIEDGINGYLIEPFDCKDMSDKIIRLMEDEELQKRFSESAKINIDKFQLQGIIEKWNRVLKHLCE